MSRVLIFGGTGLLGSELCKRFVDDCFCPTHAECDISNYTDVKKMVTVVKPDFVVNAAAYTNVDGCESDRFTAFQVNTLGAENVALACAEEGVYLVHVSTDYVFDGKKKAPYEITDDPHPLSFYGETKLQAEQRVGWLLTGSLLLDAVIIRTSWVFGRYGKSFETIDKGYL